MLRLFWAVNLTVGVKASVAAFQDELKEFRVHAKWVEQENLHLTVKFLGDVEVDLVPDVVGAVRLNLKGLPSFGLGLHGCGSFGRPARVLWVGVKGDTVSFAGLVQRVDSASDPLGFPQENRKPTPHLTIARLRSADGAGPLLQRLSAVAREGIQFGEVKVNRIDLMQSMLSPVGPQYRVLESADLD